MKEFKKMAVIKGGSSRRDLSSSSGVVLVETLLVTMFIVTCIMATVNFARALERRLALSRIAYEGARLGSDTKNLPAGLFVNLPSPASTEPINLTAAHILHERIRVLASHSISDISDLNISTDFVRGATGNRLTLTLSQDFVMPAWIPVMGRVIALQEQVTIPYLFL